VTGATRMREATPLVFAERIRSWHRWVPVTWGHDGLQHMKDSGKQLAELYSEQGLNMLDAPASFSDEKLEHGVEAGVAEIYDRMKAGKFYVFPHLREWFEEKHTYHRKDGIIVPVRNDLMDATRYAVMSKRHAIKKPSRSGSREHGPLTWKQI